MTARFRQHLSPGLVLGLIALVVAVGGSSFAIAQKGGDNTLRTRIGGATTQVTQTVTLLTQAQNNGVADYQVNCPNNPKLGQARAYSGGIFDLRPPESTRNGNAYGDSAGSPSGNGWLFQVDSDSGTAVQVQLKVLCIFPKLNTKRG